MPLPLSHTFEVPRRSPLSSGGEQGRSVLIVDDDLAHLERIERGLQPLGHRFLVAHDGAHALSILRTHRPDLILLDAELPRLDAVEVCRAVKDDPGKGVFGFIPVLLMLNGAPGTTLEALDLVADDFLIEPFEVHELTSRVRSMLRLKVLWDALERAHRELDRKHEEVLALSRTDPLTGLLNRRSFEERFAEEFARSKRYRVPLSCVLIDIDQFAGLNETWGLPFGDRVLQAVARVARDSLRDVDLLARFGSGAFLALLPETGSQDVRCVADRMRFGIERLQPEIRCTASMGIATFPVPGIESAEALLRTAEECLRSARERGWNRVVQHQE